MVRDFPETPHQTRDNTDFPRRLRESGSRLRLACPPLARRNGAPYGRDAGGESDPQLLGASAPPGRVKGDKENDTLTLPFLGVALTTVIPGGKAIERLFALTVDACPPVCLCSPIVALCVVVCLNVAPCTASCPRLSRSPATDAAPPHRAAPQPPLLAARRRTMRPLKNSRPQMARGRERARLEHAHKPISPIGSTGSLPSRSTVPQEESPGSNERKTRSANVPNRPVDSGSNRGIQWGE